MQQKAIERFMKFVSPEPTTGCWLWTGVLTMQPSKGSAYGRFTYRGEKLVASRFSWLAFRSRIPKDRYVLHKCDTPCCVNPDHLWLGTYADNCADAIRKGRHYMPKPKALLTPEDVVVIRACRGIISQRELAKKFGVVQGTIKSVQLRQIWKAV